MYNQLLPGRREYTDEFLNGLEEFINFTYQQPKYIIEGVIMCPYKLCKNEKHLAREAWKHFDWIHLDFTAEPENVRLDLCADGFIPYSQSAKPYSCWPVIIIPYNLLPKLCMTPPYKFLILIIPSPDNLKNRIDVYL